MIYYFLKSKYQSNQTSRSRGKINKEQSRVYGTVGNPARTDG
jgi:hypothetical protein